MNGGFYWGPKQKRAANLLAEGYTQAETAELIGAGLRTVQRWAADDEFADEVVRLTIMTGLSVKAVRIQAAKRELRKKEHLDSVKDKLDWLRYLQSETDGTKLDPDFISAFATAVTRLGFAPPVVAADGSDGGFAGADADGDADGDGGPAVDAASGAASPGAGEPGG